MRPRGPEQTEESQIRVGEAETAANLPDYQKIVDLRLLPDPPKDFLKPRGDEVRIMTGGLREQIPPYLIKLIYYFGGIDGPIGKQFVAQPELEKGLQDLGYADALEEDMYEISKGGVYKFRERTDEQGRKYKGRILVTFTYKCAAYCRFCTRGRHVGGEEAPMNREDIDATLDYIAENPEIDEVILSGGDSFALKREVFEYVVDRLAQMQAAGQIARVRFGTRLPIHNPDSVRDWHYEALSKLKNPHVMVHVNHPDEITAQTEEVFNRLRAAGAVLRSQTVLLKGVNDDTYVLHNLFMKLVDVGVFPYYAFHNDEVKWAQHLTIPLEELWLIYCQLRSLQSGLMSSVHFVVDVPGGSGKVPLEYIFLNNPHRIFADYKGDLFQLLKTGNIVPYTGPLLPPEPRPEIMR